MQEKFYIYTIHNALNNKVYVGWSIDPQTRWTKHKRVAAGSRTKEKFYIHRALSKYGIDSFIFSILQEFSNETDVLQAEKYWIKFFNSLDSNYGYNLTAGGEGTSGRKLSEETKNKISKAHIGMKHSERTITKIRAENIKRMQNASYKAHIVSLLTNYSKDEKNKKRGSNNVHSKLTEKEVLKIRSMFETGRFNKVSLGKTFGVDRKNIHAIVTRKTWTHI